MKRRSAPNAKWLYAHCAAPATPNRRSIKNQDDRSCLLNLIALIAVKNPHRRESFRSFHEQIAKRMMHLATATRERWEGQIRRAKAEGYVDKDADVDYQRMRDFVEANECEVRTTTGFHLELELDTFNKVLPFFFRRKWVLFRAPPHHTGFVTSDDPVCLMWSDPARRRDRHPQATACGIRRSCFLFPMS
jgi:hypothetical protein